MFLTAVAGKNHGSEEYIFYIKDYPMIHMVAIIGLFLLLFRAKRKKWLFFNDEKEINLKKHFIVIGIICIVFMLLVQAAPRADQMFVLNPSTALSQKDYSMFYPSAYFDRYGNNKGMAFILYLLSFLFGGSNYMIMQVFNIVAVLSSILFLYKIMKIYFGESIPTMKLMLTLCYLFLPIFFYVLFVYGNLYGMALAFGAVNQRMDFLKTRNINHIVISGLCMALACIIKSNFIIMAVALGICYFFDLFKKLWKSIFFVGSFLVLFLGLNWGVKAGFTAVTKLTVHNPQSSMVWLEIGLSENDKRAPGWWSEQVDSMWGNGKRNPKAMREGSKLRLESRIQKLLENPEYTMNFFSRKNVSAWANPQFESNLLLRAKHTSVSYAPMIKSLSLDEGIVQQIFLNIMNIMQTILYVGVLFYLIFGGKKRSLDEMIFLIIFIGGFIFHFFWETKSQYTLTYVFMIIPYAARGYITALDSSHRLKKEYKCSFKLLLIVFSVICIGCGMVKGTVINQQIAVAKDQENYQDYLADCRELAKMDQKVVTIKVKDFKVYLKTKKENGRLSPSKAKDKTKYQLIEENGLFRIKRKNSSKVLRKDLKYRSLEETELNYSDNNNQLLDFKKNKDGSYYIFQAERQNYVLTLSKGKGNVTFELLDEENENQKWMLEESQS